MHRGGGPFRAARLALAATVLQTMISANRSSSFLDMTESFRWVTAAMPRWLSELATDCESSQQRERLRPNVNRSKPINVHGARSTALASPNAAATPGSKATI